MNMPIELEAQAVTEISSSCSSIFFCTWVSNSRAIVKQQIVLEILRLLSLKRKIILSSRVQTRQKSLDFSGI